MPNPLDMTRMLKNPLVLAGAGMLAGSMPRPQSQAHINPWQAGMQGFLAGSELNQRDEALQAEKQAQKARQEYMEAQSAYNAALLEARPEDQKHQIALQKMKDKAALERTHITASASGDKQFMGALIALSMKGLESDRDSLAKDKDVLTLYEQLVTDMKYFTPGVGGGVRNWLQGRVGSDESRAAANRANANINALSLKGSKMLSGPISEKEGVWIKDTVLKLTDHPERWMQAAEGMRNIVAMQELRLQAKAQYIGQTQGIDLGFDSWFQNESPYAKTYQKHINELYGTSAGTDATSTTTSPQQELEIGGYKVKVIE
jgi:hypothetical protein